MAAITQQLHQAAQTRGVGAAQSNPFLGDTPQQLAALSVPGGPPGMSGRTHFLDEDEPMPGDLADPVEPMA